MIEIVNDIECAGVYYQVFDPRVGTRYQWVVDPNNLPQGVNASDVIFTSPQNNLTFVRFPQPGTYCIYSVVWV